MNGSSPAVAARSPLARFVVTVLAWLPVTFAVWYVVAPVLMFAVKYLCALAVLLFGDLVSAVEQKGSTLVFVTTFALIVKMRPLPMISLSGFDDTTMSSGLSPRSTATRARRASTPTDWITRSMVACSNTIASSERNIRSGTPLVPPGVAGLDSHGLPEVNDFKSSRSLSLSSSGHFESSRPPRTVRP